MLAAPPTPTGWKERTPAELAEGGQIWNGWRGGGRFDIGIRYRPEAADKMERLAGRKHCWLPPLPNGEMGRINIVFDATSDTMEGGWRALFGSMTSEKRARADSIRRALRAGMSVASSSCWNLSLPTARRYFCAAMASAGYPMVDGDVDVAFRARRLDRSFKMSTPSVCPASDRARMIYLRHDLGADDGADDDDWSEGELEEQLVIARDQRETEDWLQRLYAPEESSF